MKYGCQSTKRKPEFAKTIEFEIKERMSYHSEPVFDFTSKEQCNIELASILEKRYVELNPQARVEHRGFNKHQGLRAER